MKCPNCGKPYTENETICSSCGQPLSNAHYTPIASHAVRRGQKRKKYVIILFIILLLIAGCAGGYFFYIHQVERRCEAAVHQIFAMAKSMDFSSVDASYLPPDIQANPNIREYIDSYVQEELEQYEIGNLLEEAGIEIDSDQLCDEILQSASYEINGIKASWNRCEVSIHTSNTDFSTFPDVVAKEIQNNLSQSSFWDSLKNIFSSIFSGKHHRDDQEQKEESRELLQSLYEDFRVNAPETETDGTILFGISDGKWTLLSMDEELFYSYYGFSALGEETTGALQ